MTDIPDWTAEIQAAKSPWQVAQLYRHAATYLRAFGKLPELSDALHTLFLVGQSMSAIDTDKRARQLCSAVKMSTKNGRNAVLPTKEAMVNAGIHLVLAEFVLMSLARAKVAAITNTSPKNRAVAVTAALGLNNPVGSPIAQHRTGLRVPRKRVVRIESQRVGIGEFEIEESALPTNSPEAIVNSIEAFLEVKPIALRNVREASKELSNKLHIHHISLETEYYRHPELHSKWLNASKKMCRS